MKQINVNGIIIEVEKKKIKNMYLKVGQDGRVRISAPLRMPDNVITEFAHSRYGWIVMQQNKQLGRASAVPAFYEYVTGDTLFLWGKQYELHVEYNRVRNSVHAEQGKVILMLAGDEASSFPEHRRKHLDRWYKEELYKAIPEYLDKWLGIIGLGPVAVSIRDMKTRWGSCNIKSRKITLNLQLAKLDPACLEYVIVHELVHFLEKSHNHVFKAYLDRYLPDWRQRKAKLNMKQ